MRDSVTHPQNERTLRRRSSQPSQPPRIPSVDAIRAAERYLAEYRTAYRMLQVGLSHEDPCTYDSWGGAGSARRYAASRRLPPECGVHAAPALLGGEEAMWRDRLVAIRKTVLSVEEPDEKLFLFQHYIKGRTVEACAEILDISVRTAFRLKKRAVASVAAFLSSEENEESRGNGENEENEENDAGAS